jgi:hypothetical protein
MQIFEARGGRKEISHCEGGDMMKDAEKKRRAYGYALRCELPLLLP